uniref:Uncharacterized protein n=3 Tax=Bactrocera latifrons TaxID=174628 RepID=A0A0K8UMH0_BACLA
MAEDGEPHAKKKRQQPNKKWKEWEVLLIIDYLKKEPEFEAPTARFYYKRFLEKSQLDASWELVRWKVRHLKAQYSKVNDWLASNGAGLMDKTYGSTIAPKIAKMCPYFQQLREIFGKRVCTIESLMITPDVVDSASSQLCPASPAPIKVEAEAEKVEATCVSLTNIATSSVPDSTPSSAFQRTISRVPKASIGQMAAVQMQRIAIEEKKLQFEREKFEHDKKVQEKNLDVEIKKLEMEYKWKTLELEMRERVAKYEIDKKS